MPGQIRFAELLGSCRQSDGGEDALTAPSVLNSTPAEDVVSFEAIVLLITFTLKASSSEMPAPSQPATLFAMMLFVTVTSYQFAGRAGKATTSAPLICCSRNPPPLPLSALLPTIRFESMTRPGPVPSPRPGGQSRSLKVPHSLPATVLFRLAPSIAIPPPLVGSVGLVV